MSSLRSPGPDAVMLQLVVNQVLHMCVFNIWNGKSSVGRLLKCLYVRLLCKAQYVNLVGFSATLMCEDLSRLRPAVSGGV